MQAEYEAWRDQLPESLANSRTAELLEGVCDVDLDALDVDAPATTDEQGELHVTSGTRFKGGYPVQIAQISTAETCGRDGSRRPGARLGLSIATTARTNRS